MLFRTLVALLLGCLITQQATASTIDAIKARGEVACGLAEDAPGFSQMTASGTWNGLAVDFCRALAAAILGDASRVRFRPVPSPQRLEALRNGEIDLLARNERLTVSSDVEAGITFAATLFYATLAVMVPRKLALASVNELSGQRMCVSSGIDAEAMKHFLSTRNMTVTTVEADSQPRLVDAYVSQHCAGLVGDSVTLAASRLQLARTEMDTLLPERLSLQPIGVLVRVSDEQWQATVRWVMNALLLGEMYGAGQHASMPASELEASVGIGHSLGLPDNWLNAVLTQVGNYGEIYDRNLGAGSALKLPRGLNGLWTTGGLFIPIPLR